MMIFFVHALALISALLGLVRLRVREALLLMLCIVSLNNLVLPYHLLPFRGGRTLLLLALVVISCLYILLLNLRSGLFRGGRTRVAGLYLAGLCLFLVVMAVYLVITPDLRYGVWKVNHFALNTIVPVLAISLFAPLRQRELRLLLTALAGSAFVVAVQLALSPQDFAEWSVRKSIAGDIHPNNVARNIGLGIPIVMAALLGSTRPRLWKSIALVGVALVLAAVIIITGSRGPLVASAAGIVCFMVLLAFHLGSFRTISRVALVLSVCGVLGAAVFNMFVKDHPSWDRLVRYGTTPGANQSDESRLDRYRVAWDGFVNSYFIGVGPGGFTALWNGPPPGGLFDERDYPHNFLLEIAVEEGVPGLAVTFAIFGSVLAAMWMGRRRLRTEAVPIAIVYVALWVYTVINSSVSGDVATNYQMWVSGAIVWLIFARGVSEDIRNVETLDIGNSPPADVIAAGCYVLSDEPVVVVPAWRF